MISCKQIKITFLIPGERDFGVVLTLCFDIFTGICQSLRQRNTVSEWETGHTGSLFLSAHLCFASIRGNCGFSFKPLRNSVKVSVVKQPKNNLSLLKWTSLSLFLSSICQPSEWFSPHDTRTEQTRLTLSFGLRKPDESDQQKSRPHHPSLCFKDVTVPQREQRTDSAQVVGRSLSELEVSYARYTNQMAWAGEGGGCLNHTGSGWKGMNMMLFSFVMPSFHHLT